MNTENPPTSDGKRRGGSTQHLQENLVGGYLSERTERMDRLLFHLEHLEQKLNVLLALLS